MGDDEVDRCTRAGSSRRPDALAEADRLMLGSRSPHRLRPRRHQLPRAPRPRFARCRQDNDAGATPRPLDGSPVGVSAGTPRAELDDPFAVLFRRGDEVDWRRRGRASACAAPLLHRRASTRPQRRPPPSVAHGNGDRRTKRPLRPVPWLRFHGGPPHARSVGPQAVDETIARAFRRGAVGCPECRGGRCARRRRHASLAGRRASAHRRDPRGQTAPCIRRRRRGRLPMRSGGGRLTRPRRSPRSSRRARTRHCCSPNSLTPGSLKGSSRPALLAVRADRLEPGCDEHVLRSVRGSGLSQRRKQRFRGD